jgi:hypothetical protein
MSNALPSVAGAAAHDISHEIAIHIPVVKVSCCNPSFQQAFDNLFNPVDEAGFEILRSIYRDAPPRKTRLRSPDRKIDNRFLHVPPRPFVRNIIVQEHGHESFLNLNKGWFILTTGLQGEENSSGQVRSCGGKTPGPSRANLSGWGPAFEVEHELVERENQQAECAARHHWTQTDPATKERRHSSFSLIS